MRTSVTSSPLCNHPKVSDESYARLSLGEQESDLHTGVVSRYLDSLRGQPARSLAVDSSVLCTH